MRRVLFIFSLLLFVQCGRPTVVKEDGVIKPLSFTEVKSVSAIKRQIDEIKVVSLNLPEDVGFEHAKKIVATRDNGFAVMTLTYLFLFDANGEYILELSDAGGYAPKEMHNLSDVAVSYASNRIYLLDALNKVFCYDASTGEFIERITPDWGGERYRIDAIVANESTGGFYILSCNTSESKGKERKYVVSEFDGKGAMVAQYMEGDEYIFTRTLVSQSASNQSLMRPVDSDNIIYELRNGAPSPLYKVDFEGQEAPPYAIYDTKGIIKVNRYFSSDYYKFVNGVTRTPHTLSFIAATPGGGARHYIYDQESGGGIWFAANDGHSVPAPFLFADDEYHYTSYSIYSKEGLNEQADQLTRYLFNELGLLNRGEGYKLVGVKFKAL